MRKRYVVYTNKTMTGAMRGFGAPQVCFAYESHMDDIATLLHMDPLDIRLINAFNEGSLSPTGQTLQSVVVKESLLRAAERFGWNGKGSTNGGAKLLRRNATGIRCAHETARTRHGLHVVSDRLHGRGEPKLRRGEDRTKTAQRLCSPARWRRARAR